MKSFHIITIALASSLSPCFAQNSQAEWRQREIQRQLDEANSKLDEANSKLGEINARERAKEQAAIKAEEERLFNLPLDDDLIPVAKMYFRQAQSIKNPTLRAETFRKARIGLAKAQE